MLWISMFLGLLDPDPSLLCDPDLDQDTSINKQKSKKNLDFYNFFRLLIDFLSLKTDVTVPSKSNKRIT